MQKPDQVPTPAPPQTPNGPATFTLVGPDGATQTLRPPASVEELETLRARRAQISDQLENVTDRRGELAQELARTPEAAGQVSRRASPCSTAASSSWSATSPPPARSSPPRRCRSAPVPKNLLTWQPAARAAATISTKVWRPAHSRRCSSCRRFSFFFAAAGREKGRAGRRSSARMQRSGWSGSSTAWMQSPSRSSECRKVSDSSPSFSLNLTARRQYRSVPGRRRFCNPSIQPKTSPCSHD